MFPPFVISYLPSPLTISFTHLFAMFTLPYPYRRTTMHNAHHSYFPIPSLQSYHSHYPSNSLPFPHSDLPPCFFLVKIGTNNPRPHTEPNRIPLPNPSRNRPAFFPSLRRTCHLVCGRRSGSYHAFFSAPPTTTTTTTTTTTPGTGTLRIGGTEAGAGTCFSDETCEGRTRTRTRRAGVERRGISGQAGCGG